jgi:sulfur carrier protein ThiS
MSQVELNGRPHDVGPDATVADLVRSLADDASGDRIEVLTAVQGG